MKKSLFTLFSLLAITLIAFYSCQKDNLAADLFPSDFNLTEHQYFDSPIPEGAFFGVTTRPDEVTALGRLLFYDKNLSSHNNVSCGTCHSQSDAFADGRVLSPGVFGEKTKRNSMGLSYAGFQGTFFWDSRNRRIDNAVVEPILNHSEMDIESMEALVAKLKGIPEYIELFDEAYKNYIFAEDSDSSEPITTEKIARALSSFITSLYNFDSPYDVGVTTDFTNFSQEELMGKELFFGKAKCSRCHVDYNLGSYYQNTSIGLDEEYEDQGSGGGAFKVPHLRNVALTGPYMHDGRFETLGEVVEHYNSGVKKSPGLSWHLSDSDKNPIRLNLSEEEKESLVAFLHTLTDNTVVTAEKFSNPFK